MLHATCVNTPIYYSVFHNLRAHVARCSASCVNDALSRVHFFPRAKKNFCWSHALHSISIQEDHKIDGNQSNLILEKRDTPCGDCCCNFLADAFEANCVDTQNVCTYRARRRRSERTSSLRAERLRCAPSCLFPRRRGWDPSHTSTCSPGLSGPAKQSDAWDGRRVRKGAR